MKEHEMVAAVGATTGLDHTGAVGAVRAVLQVLGRRLAGGQAGNLAAQLPPALAELLPESAPGERFDAEEFVARVAETEGSPTHLEQARQHTKATLAAIKAAVGDAEFGHVASQLSADYADLLGTEPVQHH
jgi:uncharacterized protein (DUF2267 family)